MEEENENGTYQYQGQYHPIFQIIPNIVNATTREVVSNERAFIAFSTSCHANDKLGEYCGLREGRRLHINNDGRQAIYELLAFVGSQRNETIVNQTMISIFHYNIHLWNWSAFEARIPFASEEHCMSYDDEAKLYKAPLIARMFSFDDDENGFDRPSNMRIYEHRDNPIVHAYIFRIARGISSRRSDGKSESDDDSDGDLVVDVM